ncbi:MAG TPA: AAA family ATPase, partial [Chloroflexia bacterium]
MSDPAEVRTTNEDATESAPPAYFLSLTVGNFRCFGPQQTLDLSDGKGRPARWTVVLGENGVGKTSLLQCLAALQPERGRVIKDQTVYFIGTHVAPVQQFLYSLLSTREKSKAYFSISSAIYYGAKLTHAAKGKVTRQLSVASTSSNSYSRSGTLENVQGLICYGYGATRRIGKTSLSDRRDMFPSASLFYDTAELLNPEEWLLQADYAAIRQTRRRIRALRRRDQIKQVLLRLLPDVVDLRFSQSDEETFAPSVEAKTPYGWVRIQDLSLGYVTLISWIVDFASRLIDRYPSSNNPLAEPAVVLVDEIDLHLHPKWQRQLTS